MSVPISTNAGQRQQRSVVSVLPPARAGGAELSAIGQQLVEDFRQMSTGSRNVMIRFFNKQVERDREARIDKKGAGLRLVGGGA